MKICQLPFTLNKDINTASQFHDVTSKYEISMFTSPIAAKYLVSILK